MRSILGLTILTASAASANAHDVAVTHTHMGAFDTIGLFAVIAAAAGVAGVYVLRRNAKR